MKLHVKRWLGNSKKIRHIFLLLSSESSFLFFVSVPFSSQSFLDDPFSELFLTRSLIFGLEFLDSLSFLLEDGDKRLSTGKGRFVALSGLAIISNVTCKYKEYVLLHENEVLFIEFFFAIMDVNIYF